MTGFYMKRITRLNVLIKWEVEMLTLLKKVPLKALSKIYRNIDFEHMTTIIPVIQ